MDELIMFMALGGAIENVTGRMVKEFLTPDVETKIFAFIEGVDERGRSINTDRLLTLFKDATDRLIEKIDGEAV